MLTLRNPLDTAPVVTEGARFSELLGEAQPASGQEDRGGSYRRPRGPETAAATAAEGVYGRDHSRSQAI